MSARQRFRFTPKRRKVQCSNCDEIFDNDYASCHMTKHHPTLISAGKTPSITLIKESSQPNVSSFFKKSSSESCNQPEISQNETNIQDSLDPHK